MEPDLEFQKHRCKICSKSFSTGRSLGGHMRSHTRPSCFDTWEKEKEKEKEKIENGKTQASFREGYDLRENPKKTWRLSEEIVSSSKHCNECGKAFPSWKSYFNHMKLHSEMICSQSVGVDDIEEQETGSWSHRRYTGKMSPYFYRLFRGRRKGRIGHRSPLLPPRRQSQITNRSRKTSPLVS